ncbi:flagellin [Paracoccaceae bacterium]|nr:flagellin [Paracoccaceae bacterium]
MLNINTNYAAAFAANAAKQTAQGLDSAMEKLSSGLRINYAKDDAAGQAISTRLTAEVQGLAMASRNAADGQSLIDTADSALAETHNLLLRMREISVQAANGTMADATDRAAINSEIDQLVTEIERIAQNTTWAGNSLLKGNSYTFQVGTDNSTNSKITIGINDMRAVALGIAVDGNSDGDWGDASDTRIGTANQTGAQDSIGSIDTAIGRVSTARAELGAYSNRLSSTMANLDQVAVNLASSKGRIQDADFATETSNLAKNQILQQAATAMLAQANASKNSVLTLVS